MTVKCVCVYRCICVAEVDDTLLGWCVHQQDKARKHGCVCVCVCLDTLTYAKTH